MIFTENDHQPFSNYSHPQLFSNISYRSAPSPSLYKNNNILGSFSFPVISNSTINTSSFESRIHDLQLKLSEQKEISSMCNEKNTFLSSKTTSDLTQEINDIRSKIDIILQGDVRTKGRQVSDDLKNTKKRIDSLNYNDETSEIRSKISDLNRDISFFRTNFVDLSEMSQNSFRKLKFDHQRLTSQVNQSFTKLLNIENKHATIIQQSVDQNRLFDQIDEKTLSSFSLYMQNTDELIKANSTSLADYIKDESISRGSVNLLLQKQANIINENVTAHLVRLSRDFKEIHKSFNKMIQDTSSQISSSIEDIQNSTDSMIQDINASFNPLFEDIQNNFKSLQTELVSTIYSISKSTNDALLEFESVLETEAKVRKNNYNIFLDKFNQFEQFILKEKDIQNTKIKDMANKINSYKSDIFDTKMAESVKKVNYLIKNIESLDEIESKLNLIENDMNDSLNIIRDEIRKNDLTLTDIYSNFEIQKNEISKTFDFIEQSVSNFEPKRLDSKIESKQGIENKADEFNENVKRRIETTNQKIKFILNFIQENNIQLTSESKTDEDSFFNKSENLSNKIKKIESNEEESDSRAIKEIEKDEINKKSDKIIDDDKTENQCNDDSDKKVDDDKIANDDDKKDIDNKDDDDKKDIDNKKDDDKKDIDNKDDDNNKKDDDKKDIDNKVDDDIKKDDDNKNEKEKDATITNEKENKVDDTINTNKSSDDDESKKDGDDLNKITSTKSSSLINNDLFKSDDDSKYKLNANDFIIDFVDPRKK